MSNYRKVNVKINEAGDVRDGKYGKWQICKLEGEHGEQSVLLSAGKYNAPLLGKGDVGKQAVVSITSKSDGKLSGFVESVEGGATGSPVDRGNQIAWNSAVNNAINIFCAGHCARYEIKDYAEAIEQIIIARTFDGPFAKKEEPQQGPADLEDPGDDIPF